MSTMITKIFKMLVVMISLFLILVVQSWALQEPTHMSINEYIAQNTLNSFSLDNYLKTQLGMTNGYNTFFDNKEIFRWLRDGGASEDVFIRFLNHFHNPLTDKGLDLWIWGMTVKSALDWAQMTAGTQGIAGNYSWNDARVYYFWGLAADSRDMREHYFAETFRGLGQLMHLVEDMSSPAHTRDDQHLLIEGYESWARRNVALSEDSASLLISGEPSLNIFFQPSDSYPLNVRNLFDTNQYRDVNPDPAITLTGNIGLSEYTNANFFSDDTIDSQIFPSPRIDSAKKVSIDYASPNGTYKREYFYQA